MWYSWDMRDSLGVTAIILWVSQSFLESVNAQSMVYQRHISHQLHIKKIEIVQQIPKAVCLSLI
jgi:hypothetical protein